MRGTLLTCLVVLGLGLSVLLAGCGQPGDKAPPKSAPPSTQPPKPAETPQTPDAKKTAADAKSPPEGLAELPEADRALAVKQKTCPVSDEPLGSMGKPIKLEIKGRTVFLCCEGCEEDLKKDPDKYLAKLDAAGRK